jgi:hypothetical protein
MSVTHQKANHHAKTSGCASLAHNIFVCAWKEHNGCEKVFGSAKELANHSHSHDKDPRSPYQCSKDGCGLFQADMYKLAMHEERCAERPATSRSTCHRFPLNDSAEKDEPPSVIIVNRSSLHPPEGWKAGARDIKEGLPLIGKSIAAHYAAVSDYSGGSAVIHSCSNCSTRNPPVAAVDKSYLDMNVTNRQARHRAFTFTKAILTGIEAANQAGVKPTLISVGLDGWACDERMLLLWQGCVVGCVGRRASLSRRWRATGCELRIFVP